MERNTRIQESISDIISGAMQHHSMKSDGIAQELIAVPLARMAEIIDQELDTLVEQFNNELEEIRSALRD